jgi:hypothetical protein
MPKVKKSTLPKNQRKAPYKVPRPQRKPMKARQIQHSAVAMSNRVKHYAEVFLQPDKFLSAQKDWVQARALGGVSATSVLRVNSTQPYQIPAAGTPNTNTSTNAVMFLFYPMAGPDNGQTGYVGLCTPLFFHELAGSTLFIPAITVDGGTFNTWTLIPPDQGGQLFNSLVTESVAVREVAGFARVTFPSTVAAGATVTGFVTALGNGGALDLLASPNPTGGPSDVPLASFLADCRRSQVYNTSSDANGATIRYRGALGAVREFLALGNADALGIDLNTVVGAQSMLLKLQALSSVNNEIMDALAADMTALATDIDEEVAHEGEVEEYQDIQKVAISVVFSQLQAALDAIIAVTDFTDAGQLTTLDAALTAAHDLIEDGALAFLAEPVPAARETAFADTVTPIIEDTDYEDAAAAVADVGMPPAGSQLFDPNDTCFGFVVQSSTAFSSNAISVTVEVAHQVEFIPNSSIMQPTEMPSSDPHAADAIQRASNELPVIVGPHSFADWMKTLTKWLGFGSTVAKLALEVL